jgi:hypothetical protein
MNSKMTEEKWLEEFNEFVSTESTPVPEVLSEKILLRTKKLMNPSPRLVFLKLLGIHAVFGTLSLGICNQFGLNPFRTSLSLSDYFMTFGHSVCMTLCGTLFIGLSVVAAWTLLDKEEFNVLRKNSPLQVFSLSFISLATMLIFGAKVTLGIGLLWLAGAMFGGLVSTWGLGRRVLAVS